jgi:hypothetical protein
MRRKLRIVQMVTDHLQKPLTECKILDLASLEGEYSAEFVARGATVTAIEGRGINVKKAKERFSWSTDKKWSNLKFVQDDVRNLTPKKYGHFDVVLCLGILYHLDYPDCFKFIKSIADVCDDFAIIDTHIGINDERVVYEGKDYFGWRHCEYGFTPSQEIQEKSRWASINNVKSFWLTKASLINALIDGGFTSVYECQYPSWNDMPGNRIALIAMKKKREGLYTAEVDEAIMRERVPEILAVPPTAMKSNHGFSIAEETAEAKMPKFTTVLSSSQEYSSKKQRVLNWIGAALIIFCVISMIYYFTGELKVEKENMKKMQRIQYVKDSLHIEESLINIRMLRSADDTLSVEIPKWKNP